MMPRVAAIISLRHAAVDAHASFFRCFRQLLLSMLLITPLMLIRHHAVYHTRLRRCRRHSVAFARILTCWLPCLRFSRHYYVILCRFVFLMLMILRATYGAATVISTSAAAAICHVDISPLFRRCFRLYAAITLCHAIRHVFFCRAMMLMPCRLILRLPL